MLPSEIKAQRKYNKKRTAVVFRLEISERDQMEMIRQAKSAENQMRVIEQRGKWFLLYEQKVVDNKANHEFRIQKITHDIAIYSGATIEEAKARFFDKVSQDNE